jgi:hypothetical protein
MCRPPTAYVKFWANFTMFPLTDFFIVFFWRFDPKLKGKLDLTSDATNP